MNKFIEISIRDDDFFNPFQMTVESLSNVLYETGVLDGQVILTDERLSVITRAANELFNTFRMLDVVLGWEDPIPEKDETPYIYGVRIVSSDDVLPWNNSQTAYIQMSGHERGDWFIV